MLWIWEASASTACKKEMSYLMSIFLSLHTICITWLFSKYSLIFPYIVYFILNLTNLIWVSQKKKVVLCFLFFVFNKFCQLYDYKMQYQEREIMKILDRSVQYWRVTCGYESFQDKECMGGSLVYFFVKYNFNGRSNSTSIWLWCE